MLQVYLRWQAVACSTNLSLSCKRQHKHCATSGSTKLAVSIGVFHGFSPDGSAIQRVSPANIFWLLPSCASASKVLPRFRGAASSIFNGKPFTFAWCKNQGKFSTAIHYLKAGRQGRSWFQFSWLVSKQ
ncbi:hypothetical protein M3P05_20725, partial [Sansalvadorimonas sp. 2012CJ34-2]